MKALVLINESSGTAAKTGEPALREMIEKGLSEAGWTGDFEAGDADALIAAANEADGYDAVACAGGDGTQAAVAGALLERDIALLPLPCGTVNLFCRDIGLSMTIPEALAQGLAARPARLDAGRVSSDAFGARTFLNNIVFGAYADLAEAREAMRSAESLDDMSFAVAQAADALASAGSAEYRIALDGKTRTFRTNTLIVSNNAFDGSSDFIPRRGRLDAGALAVYLAEAEGGAGFTARLVEFLTGGADASQKVDLSVCERCAIEAIEGPTVFAVDGEPFEATAPVRMEIHAGSLLVLAPAFS